MTRSARNPNPIAHPPPLLMARSSPALLLLLLLAALAGVAAAGDIVHQDDEAPKIPGCANDFVLVYMAPVVCPCLFSCFHCAGLGPNFGFRVGGRVPTLGLGQSLCYLCGCLILGCFDWKSLLLDFTSCMHQYVSTQEHLCSQVVGEQLRLGYASGGALLSDLFMMNAVYLGIMYYILHMVWSDAIVF